MPKQMITVQFELPFGRVGQKQVEANVLDGFAIHPAIVDGTGWTITHAKSGLACGSPLNTERKAQLKRKLFRQLAVDGVRMADMDFQAVVKEWPKLYQQLADLKGIEVDEDHRQFAIEHLERTARLLKGVD